MGKNGVAANVASAKLQQHVETRVCAREVVGHRFFRSKIFFSIYKKLV